MLICTYCMCIYVCLHAIYVCICKPVLIDAFLRKCKDIIAYVSCVYAQKIVSHLTNWCVSASVCKSDGINKNSFYIYRNTAGLPQTILTRFLAETGTHCPHNPHTDDAGGTWLFWVVKQLAHSSREPPSCLSRFSEAIEQEKKVYYVHPVPSHTWRLSKNKTQGLWFLAITVTSRFSVYK